MRILRGANGCDELRKVPPLEMWLCIEAGDGGRVPGAGNESAGPECALRGGAALRDEGEDVRYDFGREEDLAGGRLEVWRRGWGGRRQFLLDRLNGDSERLGHGNVPVALRIESHCGEANLGYLEFQSFLESAANLERQKVCFFKVRKPSCEICAVNGKTSGD